MASSTLTTVYAVAMRLAGPHWEEVCREWQASMGSAAVPRDDGGAVGRSLADILERRGLAGPVGTP